jgi:hypothetical protein
MSKHAPGYYWVQWRTGWVDDEPERWPAPLVGEWDGQVWWFTRLETYRFASQVEVIAECPIPAAASAKNAHRHDLGNCRGDGSEQAA